MTSRAIVKNGQLGPAPEVLEYRLSDGFAVSQLLNFEGFVVLRLLLGR